MHAWPSFNLEWLILTFKMSWKSTIIGYPCLQSRHINKSPPCLEWVTNSSTLPWTVSSVFWILVVFSSPNGLNLHHFEHQAIRDNARLVQRYRLCHHIYWIICSTNFLNFDYFNFLNEIISDINVFGSLMIHLVLRQMYSTLAITKYRSFTMV